MFDQTTYEKFKTEMEDKGLFVSTPNEEGMFVLSTDDNDMKMFGSYCEFQIQDGILFVPESFQIFMNRMGCNYQIFQMYQMGFNQEILEAKGCEC